MTEPHAPLTALFCGSRDYFDCDLIRQDINALPDGSVVIEGGAKGADATAKAEARARGLHVASVPALWDEYGRAAGPLRNQSMLRLRPDVVYAYVQGASPGTRGMIRLAENAGIEVIVREVDSP